MDFQAQNFVLRFLKLFDESSIRFLNFLPYRLGNPTVVWLLLFAVVYAVLHRLLLLCIIYVDYPKGSACSKTAICALENIFLTNLTHSWIVKLSPFVEFVIFDEVKVMTTFTVAFVDTDCVQIISTFMIFGLNVPENVLSFKFELLNLVLELSFLIQKVLCYYLNEVAQFFQIIGAPDWIDHFFA